MKRNPALIPLSRFHRSMLFLALIARENAPAVKGYPEKPSEKIAYAVNFYKDHIRPHFEKEQQLWDFLDERYPSLRKLIRSLASERKELNEIFEKITMESDADLFFRMGPLLEKHVRREERELFQQLQEIATKTDMETIEKLVTLRK